MIISLEILQLQKYYLLVKYYKSVLISAVALKNVTMIYLTLYFFFLIQLDILNLVLQVD